jgi:GntR family transcriptional repressor for pyruvate dehydrogenase complex
MIADILRQRIVTGQLAEGASIPKQEELINEFKVSRPSVREALRILEAEGMIDVRKGPLGGSVVRMPNPANVASMLATVLQFQDVPMHDLATAINSLEPVCAALCAGRDDRQVEVVPILRELNEQASAAIDDEVELTRLTRLFHEALVGRCGNKTLILVAGSLESLWSAQENDWARRASGDGDFPERSARRAAVRAHERLCALIEQGDAQGAWRASARHLEERLYTGADGGNATVHAAQLRGPR